MTSGSPNGSYDRWFQRVLGLAAQQSQLETEQFLLAAEALRAEFEAWRHDEAGRRDEAWRPDTDYWSQRLATSLSHRFDLVDEAHELAAAGEEALVCARVLPAEPSLVGPMLRTSILRLSADLSAPGAVDVFAALLRCAKQVARADQDGELAAWVRDVARLLPAE